MAESPSAERIAAVVVTCDRPQELARTLAMLASQKPRPPDVVVVVDNGTQQAAVALGDPELVVRYQRSAMNLGGAGGFALGLMLALAEGADRIWLMDDDGRPEDEHCLANLLQVVREARLDAVAPVVVDTAQPARMAFPLRQHPWRRHKPIRTVAELAPDRLFPGQAHLFNGLLISTVAVLRAGLPDLRLFIRGDELDYLARLKLAGLHVATTARARFRHPAPHNEYFPVFSGYLHVTVPADARKRYYQFRNRAYVFTRRRMWLLMAVDLLRYPWFFLVCRRGDWAGLRAWCELTWQGWHGRLRHPAHLPL
jgi:rhamnopyranosyl-N-acetylglucosaminyl-diphospho-decaprenol beta-1,3/1,4-galactofuranosyltransferase